LNQGLDTTTLEPCKSITIVEIDWKPWKL
jgi:hypothetical protein